LPFRRSNEWREFAELGGLISYGPNQTGLWRQVGMSNNWGYDPEEQRTTTYTGMGMDINVHDQWAVESMGAIQGSHKGAPRLLRSNHHCRPPHDLPCHRRCDGGTRSTADEKTQIKSAALPPRTSHRLRRILAIPGGGAAARHTLARSGQGNGVSDFVLRHGLWNGAQEEAAAEIAECIAKLGTVRFAFSDAHGVVRGKTLIAADAIGALRTGVMCTPARSRTSSRSSKKRMIASTTSGTGTEDDRRDDPISPAGFARMLQRAAAAAGFGFPVHPHMLRHAAGFGYHSGTPPRVAERTSALRVGTYPRKREHRAPGDAL
jgi:hypothetical protein